MAYLNPAGYERFMGRWSARLAPVFAGFVGIGDGERVLDVGCGTGSLSRTLLDLGRNIHVVGVDPAAAYIRYARRAVPSLRAQFRVGTAETLPFADAAFDAALALLILQELPDAAGAVREMARVTCHGGCVAACKWDFRDGLPMLSLFWQAAEAVAPQAVARRRASTSMGPEYDRPEEIAELWRGCSLAEVRTAALDITMEFASFDDFWLPFLGGATPLCVFARDLNAETQGAVAKRLREMVTAAWPEGRFALPARAWAVAGIATGAGRPGGSVGARR